MNAIRLYSFSMIMSLIIAGCTATVPLAPTELDIHAKRQVPSKENCLIYIHRASQYVGSGDTLGILVDNNYIGEIAPGTFFLLESLSGVHSISTRPIPMTATPQVNIPCEGGKIYFVKLSFGFFRWSLNLLDESKGREEIESSRLIKEISLAEYPKPLLKEKGSVTRSWLGVHIQKVTPEIAKSFGLSESEGALVVDVAKGSPADKVGIKNGDIIVWFEGKKINSVEDFSRLVASTRPGTKSKLTVIRDRERKEFTVTIGTLEIVGQEVTHPSITVDTILEKAIVAKGKGDFATAVSNLKLAIQIDPKNTLSYKEAVEILLKICDREGASRVIGAGLRLNPNDPVLMNISPVTPETYHQTACRAQALNREGITLAKEAKNKAALGKFEEAVQTAPGLIPKAHYNAALILEQLGRSHEALRHYVSAQRSFLLPEDEIDTLFRLIDLTRRARIAVPENAERRYRLGIVRTNQKKYQEAIEEFEASLAEAPWLVDAYYNLGLVYDFNKDYPQALHILLIYSRLYPNAPNIGMVKTKIVELEDRLGLLGSQIGKP